MASSRLIDHDFTGRTWVLCVLTGIVVAAIIRIVVYPYSVALMESARYPTAAARRIFMQPYRASAEVFAVAVLRRLKRLRALEAKKPGRYEAEFDATWTGIGQDLIVLQNQWTNFEARARAWLKRFGDRTASWESERSDLLKVHAGLDVFWAELIVEREPKEQAAFITGFAELMMKKRTRKKRGDLSEH